MTLSIVTFAMCGVAILATTLILRHKDPESNITSMFDRVMANRVNRIAVLLIWWWIGWHFLAGQTL